MNVKNISLLLLVVETRSRRTLKPFIRNCSKSLMKTKIFDEIMQIGFAAGIYAQNVTRNFQKVKHFSAGQNMSKFRLI